LARVPLVALVVAMMVVVAVVWHVVSSHRSSPTVEVQLAESVEMTNLYTPSDRYQAAPGALVTIVCEVSTADAIGAFGAVLSGNRFVKLLPADLVLIPKRSLPDCGETTVELPPHTNAETKFYVRDGSG